MHTVLWWGNLNVRGTLGKPANMWEITAYMDLKEKGTLFLTLLLTWLGTVVAQWSRCCATSRKVAGSIPAGFS